MMEASDSLRESHETVEALLAKVARRDQAVFKKLFRGYQKRPFRYFLGLVRDEVGLQSSASRSLPVSEMPQAAWGPSPGGSRSNNAQVDEPHAWWIRHTGQSLMTRCRS